MILVFADDLSGAAELAGIAASRGLSTELSTQSVARTSAQLLAVDTETRGLPPDEAAKKCVQIYEQTAHLNPEWIFKKTDSALRGNILVETVSFAQSSGKTHILFIPANPQKKRCIIDGKYFIEGIPIDQTVFARDPEFPIRTNNVAQEIRGQKPLRIHGPKSKESGRTEGWVIPDVASSEDIEFRVNEITSNTLAAGAAEFFAAILDRSLSNCTLPFGRASGLGAPRLLISGSLASWNQGIEAIAHEKNVSTYTLQDHESWVAKACHSLKSDGMTVIAIGQAKQIGQASQVATAPLMKPSQAHLLSPLIDTASAIIGKTSLDTLLVEGGATATALIHQMGWTHFDLVPSQLEGIGCLAPKQGAHKLNLVIKPGSYPWPSSVWEDL